MTLLRLARIADVPAAPGSELRAELELLAAVGLLEARGETFSLTENGAQYLVIGGKFPVQ